MFNTIIHIFLKALKMDKIDVNVAGLDHDAIHHQVIWCGTICVQYVCNTNSG